MSGFAEFPDFPLKDTLDGGLYLPDEHYLGGGMDQLYLGHASSRADERYLISTSTDNGHQLDAVRDRLMKAAPGVFTPMFVGHFDVLGDDADRDRHRQQHCAFIEQLPDGGPLARVVSDARPHAAALGRQVGRILESALRTSEVYVMGLRPEYVWARMEGSVPVVTGIGGRNGTFFTAASRGRGLRTVPLFTRRYHAPEVSRGERYDDRSLVLMLAVIVAEWALGEYPYETDGAYGYWNLCEGRHRELSLAPGLADLLSRGMRSDPTERPDLASFVDALDAS